MSSQAPVGRILPNPFFSGTDSDASLLSAVGASSVDQLFSSIPAEVQARASLRMGPGLDEWDITRAMQTMAERNKVWPAHRSWVGAGAYRYPAPSTVDDAIRRAEFLTSYTPYQPEISQGTLQALFEYQTIAARLMGMDISNGSVYDGPTGLAEAIKMGLRLRPKTNTVWISSALSRQCVRVIRTYLSETGVDLRELSFGAATGRVDLAPVADGDIVALGYPNALGVLEDLAEARSRNPKGIVISYTPDPHALAILREPGAFGVDIAVGEGQPFGIAISHGGPYLGILTTRKEYLRQMPGRVAGLTKDKHGKRGFVLTLSTREQHIRREKATSNICSNQGLMAVAFTVYAETLGWTGLQTMARRVYDNRVQLESVLKAKGVKLMPGTRYNECVTLDERIPAVAQTLASEGWWFGLAAECVTGAALPSHAWLLCAPALAQPADVAALTTRLGELL